MAGVVRSRAHKRVRQIINPDNPLIALGYVFPSDRTTANIDAEETKLGGLGATLMFYKTMGTSGWSTTEMDTIRNRGLTPIVSWETGSWTLPSVYGGSHNSGTNEIDNFADGAAAWGYQLIVRLDYEFNGHFALWNESKAGNAAGDFVLMWQYVVARCRARGATNILWMWSPNCDDGGSSYTRPLSGQYPGDAYVDIIGLDGYNWGTHPSGNGWQTYEQVFGSTYDTIVGIAPSKLVWIGEVGCVDDSYASGGHTKAEWFGLLPSAIGSRTPRVGQVTYFDWNNSPNWTVDSSPGSLAAWKAGPISRLGGDIAAALTTR